MATGRYAEGARNRQAVLDYVNANPWALAPDIIAALGLDKVTGATRLAKMTKAGELERRKAIHNGKTATYAYLGLVKVTRSPVEVAKIVSANVKPVVVKAKPKWMIVNTDPNRPCIPCPDAMHSGRRFGSMQSCADWA